MILQGAFKNNNVRGNNIYTNSHYIYFSFLLKGATIPYGITINQRPDFQEETRHIYFVQGSKKKRIL